jgi:HrpA-like RNA helicase
MNDNIGILDIKGENKNPLTDKEYSETYKKWAKIWSKYPAYGKAKEIIETIRNYQVLLIISGTASGKTVLVPKFALHALGYDSKIAITLPKQIISKIAAEFAALTLDVTLGKEVGYQYKGSDKKGKSSRTKLLYATDGTIVVKLLMDPLLSEFDAVIIDEAHERKIQTDFLLYLLRNTIKNRPEFKLIIMSATIDSSLFESYFSDYKFKTLFVSGKTSYPITSIFLDDPVNEKDFLSVGFGIIKNIVTDINKNKNKNKNVISDSNESTESNDSNKSNEWNESNESKESNDILFFVTTVNETKKLCEMITKEKILNKCIEVYSGMDEKKLIKNENNVRLYVATNVAESSLTIEGIKYVIDSGYELTNYYDPDIRANVLEKRFISQAQAIQRKGRSGRTAPGICYHLYTENQFEKMIKYPEPSIRTTNIYHECLKLLNLPQVKTIPNLLDVLSNFIEPPLEKYTNSGISDLIQLDLVKDDQITELGRIVAESQMDPMVGISLVLAYKLLCAREVSCIFSLIEACKGSISELFSVPSNITIENENALEKIRKKYNFEKKQFAHRYGDHLSLLKIYSAYTNKRKSYQNRTKEQKDRDLQEWCYKRFLKKSVLEKAIKNYHKTSDKIRQLMKSAEPLTIPDINKLEYKIILSISYGFRLNILSISSLKNIKINKESFLSLGELSKDMANNIVYNELIANSGKLEVTIVSKIPPKIESVIESMNNII